MKTTHYLFLIACLTGFFSCTKNIEKPIAKKEVPSVCFSNEDIRKCRDCIGSVADSCIARYDYQSESTDEYGFTDKVITNKDYAFVKKHQCKKPIRKPLMELSNRDEVLDLVPAWNSFINEGCATTWDNLTAVRVNGVWKWWSQIPDWSPNPTDIYKHRFTFFWEVRNPFGEEDPMGSHPDYTRLETGWFLQPVSTYGNLGQVCMGTQPVACLVKDNYTGVWYKNELLSQASYLCGGQSDCNYGYNVFDVQYASYQPGYVYVIDPPVFNLYN